MITFARCLSLPREQIDLLYHKYSEALAGTGKEIGIHAHNNLQLAFANTIEAGLEFGKKKDLMSAIFAANLRLQKKTGSTNGN